MAQHEKLTSAEREAITNEVNEYLKKTGTSGNRLAREAGVVQPFVWSVLNGRFEVSTPRLRRLMQYIHMKNHAPDPDVAEMDASVARFMAAGGDLGLLRSSIDMLAAAFEEERRRVERRRAEKRAA